MTQQQDNSAPRIRISIADEDTAYLIKQIWQHPDGRTLINSAAEHQVRIIKEKMRLSAAAIPGKYSPEQNIIYYTLFDDLQGVMTLVHELRHTQQDRILQFNKRFCLSPLEQVIFTRAIEADAFAFTAAVLSDMAEKRIIKCILTDGGLAASPPGLLTKAFTLFSRRPPVQSPADTYTSVFNTFLKHRVASVYDKKLLKEIPLQAWQTSPALDLANAFGSSTSLPMPGGGEVKFEALIERARKSLTEEQRRNIAIQPKAARPQAA